ncbi:hypothetical protein ABKN59_005146 [Abortiporus biennis]
MCFCGQMWDNGISFYFIGLGVFAIERDYRRDHSIHSLEIRGQATRTKERHGSELVGSERMSENAGLERGAKKVKLCSDHSCAGWKNVDRIVKFG